MTRLEAKIETAIQLAAERENSEFALFYLGSGRWRAEAVNPSASVMLGEIDGLYRGEGPTAEDAVSDLIVSLAK
jgi:hypothetical protein